MNLRTLVMSTLSSALVAGVAVGSGLAGIPGVSGVVGVSVVGGMTQASAATKTPATTTPPPVVRVAAGASIPQPVQAVGVVEDDDGDGVPDTVPTPGQAAPPPVSVNGWRCPVPVGKFTNDWGQARSGGRSHTGTDMLAPRGTPIFAPIAGTVKFDTSTRGGLSFYLDTPSGLQLYGAHMQDVGASGKVESGTIIGYVGDSGNAKGTPHLHFEVHPTKKSKTNPYPLLKQIC